LVKDVGFTFEQGSAADLAAMLHFLIANPVLRETAGRAAKKRIREQYLWPKVATDIEKVYFDLMGWEAVAESKKKPSGRVLNVADGSRRRTG
jgi:glycosyltransferase involved in cell wall biosynthesis